MRDIKTKLIKLLPNNEEFDLLTILNQKNRSNEKGINYFNYNIN